jgi:hypothetical protein
MVRVRGLLLLGGLGAAFCAVGACGGGAFSVAQGDDGGSEAGSGSGGSSSGSGSGSGSSSGSGDDAGPSDAASSSSGGDAEAGTGWCATHKPYYFCEDFDEQTDVATFLASWTTYEQSGSGAFRFDHTSVPSPPNALGVAGGNGSSFLVIKSFNGLSKPKLLRLEFDLRINSAGTVGLVSAAGFAAIAFGNSIDAGYAAVAIGNGPVIEAAWATAGDAGPSDGGTYASAQATTPFPPLGQWAGRYAIVVDYTATSSGAAGCVQVYQGPTALLAKCLPLPPSLANPSTVSIVLGDLAAGLQNTGNVDLEFDDVTLNVTP